MRNILIPGGNATFPISSADQTTLLAAAQPGYILTVVPGSAVGAPVYATIANTSSKQILGVSYDQPYGNAVTVQILGFAKTTSGGVVNVGDYVTPNASGQAITAVPSASATVEYPILGVAYSASTAAGQEITVKIDIQTL